MMLMLLGVMFFIFVTLTFLYIFNDLRSIYFFIFNTFFTNYVKVEYEFSRSSVFLVHAAYNLRSALSLIYFSLTLTLSSFIIQCGGMWRLVLGVLMLFWSALNSTLILLYIPRFLITSPSLWLWLSLLHFPLPLYKYGVMWSLVGVFILLWCAFNSYTLILLYLMAFLFSLSLPVTPLLSSTPIMCGVMCRLIRVLLLFWWAFDSSTFILLCFLVFIFFILSVPVSHLHFPLPL